MIIAILKETQKQENRVAITPQVCKKLCDKHQIFCQKDAGLKAGFSNQEYISSGCQISSDINQIYKQCNCFITVNRLSDKEIEKLPNGCTLISNFYYQYPLELIKYKKIRCYALEKIPRISRAQMCDVLSSQDNIAGYKASLLASDMSSKVVPMLMTSAGTIPAQKFLIIGLGIAGLQAAATAKRLGGIVFAYDNNPQTAEQAVSVGASYINKTEFHKILPTIDIIICSISQFGKKARLLLTKTDLALLKKQCIIIDMGANSVAPNNNIIIIRNNRLASLVANSASALFAENIYNFLSLNFDFSDEIISKSCLNKGDK